jgi:type II secretion system protein G
MNKYNKKNNFKIAGFTMIELLIVIVIMGILSAIGLGTFTSSQQKARDSKRKSNIRSISDALETYYNDFGSYPVSGDGDIFGCGAGAVEECVPGGQWENTDIGIDTIYMIQIPEDPNSGKYYYISDGTKYQLYAHLENDKDKDVPKDVNNDPLNYEEPEIDSGSSACVTGGCNYGKSSTNVGLGGLSS